MKPSTRARLGHMLAALDDIAALTERFTISDVRTSSLARAALERFFEVVSEASRHIPDDLKAEAPMVPWRENAALGNVIRHAYDGVDCDQLWFLATVEAPALRTMVVAMRDALGDKPDVTRP